MELRGKRALVTGGGVRVGRALAYALLRQGADVAIHYHQSAHGASQTAMEGEAMGRRAVTLQADLSDPGAAEALPARAAAALGGLDILVNSAAIMERVPLAEVTPEAWNRTMDVNLRGPFFVSRGAAAVLGEGGAIVSIADLAAFERWTGYPVHVISKAGVVVMTELLAKALAPRIRVNAIAPGAVMTEKQLRLWYTEETADAIAERQLIKKRLLPEEVARAALFLAADDSRMITKQCILVDAGIR